MLQYLELEPVPQATGLEEGRDLVAAVLKSDLPLCAIDLAGVELDLEPALRGEAMEGLFGDQLNEAGYGLFDHFGFDREEEEDDAPLHRDGTLWEPRKVTFHLTAPHGVYKGYFLRPTDYFCQQYLRADDESTPDFKHQTVDDTFFEPNGYMTVLPAPSLLVFPTAGRDLFVHQFQTVQFPRRAHVWIAQQTLPSTDPSIKKAGTFNNDI
jgi:hypothetical protein